MLLEYFITDILIKYSKRRNNEKIFIARLFF